MSFQILLKNLALKGIFLTKELKNDLEKDSGKLDLFLFKVEKSTGGPYPVFNRKNYQVLTEGKENDPIKFPFPSGISILTPLEYPTKFQEGANGLRKVLINRYFKSKKYILHNNPRTDKETNSAKAIDNKERDGLFICRIYKIGELKTVSGEFIKLECQDMEGIFNVYISKKKESLYEKDYFVGQIIGIYGFLKYRKPSLYLFAEEIYPIPPIKKASPRDLESTKGKGKALFISDLHFGGKYFNKKKWNGLCEWINSHEEIKYILAAGDIVEGVDVFPKQDKEIELFDIEEQYIEAHKQLKKIRKDISIFLIPGNHDFTTPSEPQNFNPKIRFGESNIFLLPNPTILNIHGRIICLYHGESLTNTNQKIGARMDSLDGNIYHLSQRHLDPLFSGHQAPLGKDYHFLEEDIDVLATGHTHFSEWVEWNGIKIISSSTTYEQTPYQKRQNIIPDPYEPILYDLETEECTHISFYREE